MQSWTVLHCTVLAMGHTAGRLAVGKELDLDPVSSAQLSDRINGLVAMLGGCERILRTPIYTPYTRYAHIIDITAACYGDGHSTSRPAGSCRHRLSLWRSVIFLS
jgi:hypothetical protein